MGKLAHGMQKCCRVERPKDNGGRRGENRPPSLARVVPSPHVEQEQQEKTTLRNEIIALKWQKKIRQTLVKNNKPLKMSNSLVRVKSRRTRTVEAIQQNHQNHRELALKNIERQHSERRSSLKLRILERVKRRGGGEEVNASLGHEMAVVAERALVKGGQAVSTGVVGKVPIDGSATAVAKEAVGREAVGKEAVVKQVVGKEAVGKEAVVKEAVAKEVVAKEAVVKQVVAEQALAKQASTQSTSVPTSTALATDKTEKRVNKIRLALCKVMKTPETFQSWMARHGARQHDQALTKVLPRVVFTKLVRKVLKRIAKGKVKESFVEAIWASAKQGSRNEVLWEVIEQDVVKSWVFSGVSRSANVTSIKIAPRLEQQESLPLPPLAQASTVQIKSSMDHKKSRAAKDAQHQERAKVASVSYGRAARQAQKGIDEPVAKKLFGKLSQNMGYIEFEKIPRVLVLMKLASNDIGVFTRKVQNDYAFNKSTRLDEAMFVTVLLHGLSVFKD